MTTTHIHLAIEDEQINGEIALVVAPGTSSEVQTRAIDDALEAPLSSKAKELGLVMDAAPSRYTRAVPGKDAEGRLRFAVRGRAEGDRLVPNHVSNRMKRR